MILFLNTLEIIDNSISYRLTEKLQEILHLVKPKEKIEETENKLISKYL